MMESEPADSSAQPQAKPPPVEPLGKVNDVEAPVKSADLGASDKANVNDGVAYANGADVQPLQANTIRFVPPNVTAGHASPHESVPFVVAPSASGVSTWAKNFSFPQPRAPQPQAPSQESAQGGLLDSFTKGIVDSSLSAVRAVQVKARHMVSQNKRRYQEGEFDLDMAYITENMIAMGFPAGNLSSGLFGFLEGFYRNHMEDVIRFFETHHKGKYKVYNLCSERLYDASLFEGKVASFPFDDHNCPPLQLIPSFCQSAYSWLKGDIENVVVVHCKAGMGRTGLMICSLLLFLKLFETAEQAITFFNQKRCIDGKALVLPSQIRYVKYFEHILKHFNGANQPGRRCMLRGFRLHNCPYWIRPSITISNHGGVLFTTRKHPKTKDLMPEDFWIKVPRKGITVFALPGEPGLAEVVGDFKIHFHDRQGDFYCWLNATLTENRKLLDGFDFDGFDKRKVPSPGFQVEIIMIDYNGTLPTRPKGDSADKADRNLSHNRNDVEANSSENKVSANEDNDDVFSDEEGEESGLSKSNQQPQATATVGQSVPSQSAKQAPESVGTITHETSNLFLSSQENTKQSASKELNAGGGGKPALSVDIPTLDSVGSSDIKAIAADASVFSFGDEDYESE